MDYGRVCLVHSGIFIVGTIFGIIMCVLMYRRKLKDVTANARNGKTVADDSVGLIYNQDSDFYKLVIVVRTDLKIGMGEMAALCSSISVSSHEEARKRSHNILKKWLTCDQKTVVAKVDSEDELIQLAVHAKSIGLITNLIKDAGRAKLSDNAKSVLGIGPGPEELINKITGHLKLY